MRCLSCDKLLSDKENSRRSLLTGEYLQLCDDPCYKSIADQVPSVINPKHAEAPEVPDDT